MDRSFHKRFLLLLSLITLSNGQPRAVADSCAKACKKYVLSIDGGGVRGIVAARILQEIETRTGKRIHELFDLIIGNSTGGILALGLAMPDPDKQGQSKYTAHDLVKFYQDNCAKIFPQGLCYQLMAGWGLWAPKYSRASLDSILHQYMQETMLSETLVPVAVTSYSLNYAAPHLWTTRRARIDPHYDYLLHDVAGATSAAPVYFAPKIIQKSDGTVLCEADGGIWANNPEIIAITELREMYNAPVEPQDVFLLSIAAYAPKAHHRLPDLQHSGLLGWILGADLVNLMINADVEWAEVAIAAIYPASKRIKVVVPAALGSMDNSSSKSMRGLLQAAEDYIAQHEQEIDDLCRTLVR